jgi:hypothetical protein
MNAPQYMFSAREKPSLPLHRVPLIEATEESIRGYGCLVEDPDGFEIEIVRWPALGSRPIDEGTGDEGGYVEGVFQCDWTGNMLMGKNDAVNGEYVLGWSRDPQQASSDRQTADRDRVLLWHMNYLLATHCRPSHTTAFSPINKGYCRFMCCSLLHTVANHCICFGRRKG